MKLVADTNILISGSLWQGPSARLISAALSGRAQLFLSLSLLLELREALQRPRFAQRLVAQGETPETIMERFRAACHEAVPAPITPPPDLRDPNDFHVLACAVAVCADVIVSGDKDLLTPGSFQGIPIQSSQQALQRLSLLE